MIVMVTTVTFVILTVINEKNINLNNQNYSFSNTIEPVFKGHPSGHKNVVWQDR